MMLNASMANMTAYNVSRAGKGLDSGQVDVRRHFERLLLRLDFNGGFSMRVGKRTGRMRKILKEEGLA